MGQSARGFVEGQRVRRNTVALRATWDEELIPLAKAPQDVVAASARRAPRIVANNAPAPPPGNPDGGGRRGPPGWQRRPAGARTDRGHGVSALWPRQARPSTMSRYVAGGSARPIPRRLSMEARRWRIRFQRKTDSSRWRWTCFRCRPWYTPFVQRLKSEKTRWSTSGRRAPCGRRPPFSHAGRWAGRCARHFDLGALTVVRDMNVRVSGRVAGDKARKLDDEIHERPIALPRGASMAPARQCMHWHNERTSKGAVR